MSHNMPGAPPSVTCSKLMDAHDCHAYSTHSVHQLVMKQTVLASETSPVLLAAHLILELGCSLLYLLFNLLLLACILRRFVHQPPICCVVHQQLFNHWLKLVYPLLHVEPSCVLWCCWIVRCEHLCHFLLQVLLSKLQLIVRLVDLLCWLQGCECLSGLSAQLNQGVSASCAAVTMGTHQSKLVWDPIFGFGRPRRHWSLSNRLARCSLFADLQVFLPRRSLQTSGRPRLGASYLLNKVAMLQSFASVKSEIAQGGRQINVP